MEAASASTPRRTRFESEAQYIDTEMGDLVDMLRSTNDMETHGDILHYMVTTYGMSYKTSIGVIKDLLRYNFCQARVQVPNPLSKQAPNPDSKVSLSLKNPKNPILWTGADTIITWATTTPPHPTPNF